MKLTTVVSTWVGALFCWAPCTQGVDWPQWRYDAYHSADSPEVLPNTLQLQWSRQYSPRVQTWDDPLNNDLITYDRVFEPVVLGDRMFIGFNDCDKVVALDIDDGRELWTFFTDGPVRLPPAAWKGKVYFVSDDGYLYCVNARDGRLVWQFRGGPSERKVLGNERVVSAWPARGGPVIRDGQVYFAASIWPFMGTFIYALDADDGRVVWVNDSTGSQYIKQPHSAPSFAGVAPQGVLVATHDLLLVPGGRSVPAGFDRHTGKYLFFQLEDSGKGNGGSFVMANESEFYVHTRYRGTRAHDLKTGKKSTFTINEPVLTTNRTYSAQESSYLKTAVLEAGQKLFAARQTEADAHAEVMRTLEEADQAAYKKATNSLASAKRKVTRAEQDLAAAQKALGTNWAGHVIQAVGRDKKVRWEINADGTGDIIKAGRRLYAAGTNSIVALEIPPRGGQPQLAWSNYVDGRVLRLLAANGKLFAVTLDGRILAFGGGRKPATPLMHLRDGNAPAPESTASSRSGGEDDGALEGYALWFGVDDGGLLEAVLRQSKLHVTAVDPNGAKVDQLRRRFDAAGLYGKRVALHVGDPLSFQAPPYIADLVVMGESLAPRVFDPAVIRTVYASVRPYGGRLWVLTAATNAADLAGPIHAAGLPQASVSLADLGVHVVREGALPGSADWTHQYGDVANTVKSDDRLVRLPLGLLWFGGPTHMDVLPRHGHGPSEQVVGGRLFIEGMSSLSARDVYTGRVLWKTEFEDLGNFGIYYDASYTNLPLTTAYNQKHIAGANARGANYVATDEAVYLAISNTCRVLDVRNGQTLRTLALPQREGESLPDQWSYIGIYEDLLLAGAGFAHYTQRLNLSTTNRPPAMVDYSASRGLVAFDRHSGQMRWRVDARYSFLNNGIVAGNGRIYCLDKLPKSAEDKLKRRGRVVPKDYRLIALDASNGEQVWQATSNIFGTWLGFSKQHDVLLQAGASATDRLKDEAEKGMITYRGRDGSILWTNLAVKYTGPCILHNDTILTTPTAYKTNAGAFGLLDGQPRTVINPLTGQPEPLRIYRTYGCNYPVACENLLTFRSGAAGFYDLEKHGGTGNLGGFKSGCSANLIAANGVLNAPDYTRTCSCPYQNQTSLAFVHMPELEWWTYNQYGVDARDGTRIKRVGINFGAPGDRLAETGTLWVDYPNVSGSSPNLSIVVKGSKTNYFTRHSSTIQGPGPVWVMASGVRNVETISIGPETRRLVPPPPAPKKTTSEDDTDEDDEKNGNETSKDDAAKAGSKSGSARSQSSGKTASTSTKTNRVESVYYSKLAPAAYTVRLYFKEPDDVPPGERVFDVSLQGQTVLKNLDVVTEAGGTLRGLMKEFHGVILQDQLVIKFTPARGKKLGPVISGVELILEEAVAGELLLPAGN